VIISLPIDYQKSFGYLHRAAVNKKRNPTREAWGYLSYGKRKNLKNLVIKCRN